MRKRHSIFKEGKLEGCIILYPYAADEEDVRDSAPTPDSPKIIGVHKIGEYLDLESDDSSPLSSFGVWFVMTLEK